MVSSKNLPIDVVINILQFDGRFRVRGGEIIDKLDKNKHKGIINFLLNKPLPDFRHYVIGLREKCHDVRLSQDIQIHYILKSNASDKIEGMEIRLWKKYQFLNRVICE